MPEPRVEIVADTARGPVAVDLATARTEVVAGWAANGLPEAKAELLARITRGGER
jgi:hypothetical protein